ncbi:TPA: helix-turn-helix transcriptional regulator [Streptococcus suis]|nr:helix-turn-helix transcriptional regulator [Streptococcus suis]HEM3515256.1 helix-turn-helix transcriptional regulator [Streptococcus suis]
MKISYNPLWQTLAKKGIGKNQFRSEAKISSSTHTKLVNDECTTTDTLLRIANYLKCDISDIVKFVEE